ncbi:MAG TPA: SBBP repeat-containing protein, partial [Bacteroidia bacterium]|nr:SBBP repeat-containing protein [Bacteroidia bacterium]
MKKTLLLSVLLLSTMGFVFAQKPTVTQTSPGQTEIGFVENKGQLADHKGNLLPDVLFQSSGTGPQIYITTSGLTYIFHQHTSVVADKDEKNTPVNWSKIEMQFQGTSIRKENIVVENPIPGYSNFYYANCPQGILNVKTYQKITIKNIYPGIDWVLNADNVNGLSHDFIVHPEGNSSDIRIVYKGIDNLPVIDKTGHMILHSDYGDISEGVLNVYEEKSGQKLKANFRFQGKTLQYQISPRKNNSTIIIDPPLQWNMPQSSTDFDYGYAVAAAHDGSGDVLVTGATDGTDFPTLNAYQGTLSGIEDMVIERLNASGTRLWSTYYGGTDYEQGKGIASDNAGNCYVAGNTGSTDFPALNPIQPNYGFGVYDIAIVKLNASGVRQFASWFGSGGNDYGNAIAVDGTGNMYVTGYTNSQFFPVTGNAIQSTKNIGYDCFVMKISAAYALQFATFYGGDDDDKARAITIDSTGTNIFITGSTLSGTFPVTGGVFQASSGSAYNAEDAFILKMSTAQVVQWATFCGGNDVDYGQGIAIDHNSNVFITGYTLSSNYPLLTPGSGAYFDGTIGNAGYDAFITEVTSDGTAKIWSTYFGGGGLDMGFAITYDPGKGIFVCGNTASTNFPTHQPIDNNYYQSVQGDGGSFNDMFIAWFNTNDSLKWSTYYGGATNDEAYGISVDAQNNIF